MKKTLLSIVIVLLIIGLGVFGGLYFKKHRDLNAKFNELSKKYDELASNPQAAQAAEVRRYIEEVGKVYDLPDGEEPSVATVKDKEQLKEQPFFAKAENGDVTLIYSTAKLALLYRPSTKQLVNVSTVTIQEEQQPAPETTPTE